MLPEVVAYGCGICACADCRALGIFRYDKAVSDPGDFYKWINVPVVGTNDCSLTTPDDVVVPSYGSVVPVGVDRLVRRSHKDVVLDYSVACGIWKELAVVDFWCSI